MTKPKYATAEERRAARSEKAKKQMDAQWERKRQEEGNSLGYFGGHARVRRARGPAKTHQCSRCPSPALHWAQIHGTSGESPDHYEAMCQPCHFDYDGVRKQQVNTMTSEERSAAAKLAWSRRTPEERSSIAKRAWETKHAKAQEVPDRDPATGRFVGGSGNMVALDNRPSIPADGHF